jgi:hypothetical protein
MCYIWLCQLRLSRSHKLQVWSKATMIRELDETKKNKEINKQMKIKMKGLNYITFLSPWNVSENYEK